MGDEGIQNKQQQRARELERQASQAQRGVFGEFVDFFVEHKKWWLTPIVLVLLLVGLILVLSGTGAGPFIYTLF